MAAITTTLSNNNSNNGSGNGNKKKRRVPLFCVICGLLLICLTILAYNVWYHLPEPSQQPFHRPVKTQRQIEACRRMKSVADIQECYPPQLVRPLSDRNCTHVDDWEDVQKCLTGTFYPEDFSDTEDPFTIHIVGERHSGTKFLSRELQKCFLKPSAAKHVTKIHRDFIRIKHFFQPVHHRQTVGNYRRNIVVVIVRDPVEWAAAMHEMPYHSPGHIKAFILDPEENEREVEPLPWQEFVARPWTIHRSQEDTLLLEQKNQQPIPCQQEFAWHEVMPCQPDNVSYAIPPEQMRAMYPLYELRRDGSGEPYDHILQLRSDKIVNMVLQLPMLFSLGGFMVVRYEDLLQKGSQFLLEQIAHMVGMRNLPVECKPAKPQPERLKQRYIPTGFKEWVEANLDKEREKLIGY